MNFKANFVIYITYRFVTQGHRLNIDRTYVRYMLKMNMFQLFWGFQEGIKNVQYK